MKIVLNTHRDDIIKEFILLSSNDKVEIIVAKQERVLFDCIVLGDVDAIVVDNHGVYCQNAVDFAKKKQPYTPMVIIGGDGIDKTMNADIYIPYVEFGYMYNILMRCIASYEKNFSSLKKLTAKSNRVVEFGECAFDPSKRTLYKNGVEVAKISEKASGILYVLAINYGRLVRKELILQKVWAKSDFFSSRSMDVYVTNIRKTFRECGINLTIRTVSKSGLILE